jgi:hypothetical protein
MSFVLFMVLVNFVKCLIRIVRLVFIINNNNNNNNNLFECKPCGCDPFYGCLTSLFLQQKFLRNKSLTHFEVSDMPCWLGVNIACDEQVHVQDDP